VPSSLSRKHLVAHRGACAYAPEHTLASYRLALEQRADFVEQDLAVTRDGALVSIHDLSLERTTNVAAVFPDRFVMDTTGAEPVRRWLVNDFTLEEIRQLDAGAWFDPSFLGARVPTFREAIDTVRGKAGIYPELKDPEFYRQRGIRVDQLFVEALRANGLLDDPETPVIAQSFDAQTLKQLAIDLPAVARVFLVEPTDIVLVDSPEKIREIGAWATGVAPNKAIVERLPDVVGWAHAAGLTVTPWTFRGSDHRGYPSVRVEMEKFLYGYGVDAVFTDNPDQFPRQE
jgi:glycerophosphoryl diester phosphodiesterase